MSIDSVFSVIRSQQNVVFSYSNNLPLNTRVHFDKTSLLVIEIIKIISTQAEINYKIQGRKIMIYQKAKKHTIYGFVRDNTTGEPIPGVYIRLKDQNFGTATDEKGNYSLHLYEGEYALLYSIVGYESVEKQISIISNTELDVKLKASNIKLNEVTVTRQRNFYRNLEVGRNIHTIYSKQIESLNRNNAADILQGSIPGVWSTQSSGAPGDHQKVKIRGINSIFGCTDPLYIIDGVAVPIVNLHSLGIADLNIHDIETITVLKDASSCAIYGYQGGNGVVIIDTKRANEKHISFSTKFGIQRLPKELDLMNTKDFLSALDSAKAKKISISRNYYPPYSDELSSEDGQDEVFQDGTINEYQLSGSGKVGKANYFISGNYWNHKGIIVHSSYTKYTASAKISRNFGQKLSLEFNTRHGMQLNENNLDLFNGNDLLIEGINKSPLIKSTPDSLYFFPFPHVAKINGEQMLPANRTYIWYDPMSWYSHRPADSTMASIDNSLKIATHNFDLRAKYVLSESLFLNVSSSLSLRNNQYKTYEKMPLPTYNGIDFGLMSENENFTLLNKMVNLN